MLNIQKVKGILSARNGTQIPKFQAPAGTLNVNNQIPEELQNIPGISTIWSTLNNTAKQRLIDTYKNKKSSLDISDLINQAFQSTSNAYDEAKKAEQSTPSVKDNKEEKQSLKQVEGTKEVKTKTEEEQTQTTLAATNSTVDPNVKKIQTQQEQAKEKQNNSPSPAVTQQEPSPSQGINTQNNRVTYTLPPINFSNEDIAGQFTTKPTPGKDLEHLQLRSEINPVVQKANEQAEANKTTLKQMGVSAAKGVGIAADVIDQYLKNKYDYSSDASSVNGTGRQAYNAVANSLMSFGPVGTVAGGAMKVLGTANDAFGKTTDNFTADTETINQIGGSYGGSVADIDDAVASANKKYGLLDGSKVRKANAKIKEARRQQSVMKGIASNAADMQQSQSMLSQLNAMDYQYQLDGGYDQRYMRAAKEGAKIQYFKDPFKVDLSDIATFQVELSDTPSLFKAGGTIVDSLDNQFIFKVKLSDIPEIESFKKGGSIPDREIEVIETNTTQKSVIPEGALHKNKHHLDEVGVDDSELTKKGIPVVDNAGDQQAEIELNEIIFTLEVTKELESRYKEFYEEGTSQAKKDELAIEAGKLLWKEILYNTDDRTGLIDTLKKGGTLKAQEGIQVPDALSVKVPDQSFSIKHKPTYQEWIKTVNPDYINPNYDLETAYKYLPFEQIERWRFAVNQPTKKLQDYYLNRQDSKTGEFIYYTSSIAKLPNGDYIFLKKGTEKTNPEVHWETDTYHSGTNGLKETHDLVYDTKEGRYFYRKKKAKKHESGGILTQSDIDKMVKQALINILTNE